MGRKNTSKAAMLSTTFRKALYRFGSYEENSTTIMNLLFEQGVSRRNVSAFFEILSDTFGVDVADFTVTQDLTSTESFEVAFHSFADAAAFNASPNSAEILAAFKQMLATRFGVQVSDITLTVVDGSAKFQTAVATATPDVATAIQSDFGNPVELEKMFTTEMATAIDAQGVSGAALTNLDNFFFRGGDRSAPPEMLSPGASDFVAIPTTRTASVVPEVPESTTTFYKYQEVPAEDITTATSSGVSVIFPVNGNQVVHFNSVSPQQLASTPRAFLATGSIPSFPIWGATGTYSQDAGATLSYKFIHNDFSQETEWTPLVIGSPYTDVVWRAWTDGDFDSDTQHFLLRHDQSDQQIAYFFGSIPDPLPAP